MRSFVVVLALWSLGAIAEPTGSGVAEAEALLTAMRAKDSYATVVDQVVAQFPATGGAVPNEAAQRALFDRIFNGMAAIYADVYSVEELRGMRAFFESPAGQAFLDKKPLLTEKYLQLAKRIVVEWRQEQDLRAPADAQPEPDRSGR